VSTFKSPRRNSPIENSKSICNISLTKYDPDQQHTKDSSDSDRVIIGRKITGTERKPTQYFRQFMVPRGGSMRKITPPQSNPSYKHRILPSSLIGTDVYTPVDQPVAETSMADINEILMAGRMMRVEKRAKEMQKKMFITDTQNLPPSGCALLPEPPINSFVLTFNEDKRTGRGPNTHGEKKLKPQYGGSSKFLREFKVLGKIGSGSFGMVLKAVSRWDGCTYAVKKMHKMSIPLKLRAREMRCMAAIWAQGSCDSLVKYFSG